MIPSTDSVVPAVFSLGEGAVVVDWGSIISPEINSRVTVAADRLMADPFPGFKEVVPAYSSLGIFFDPLVVQAHFPGKATGDAVAEMIRPMLAEDHSTALASVESRLHRIPVVYDGPDLADVASLHQLTVSEVVDIHSAMEYRVYMMGFLPGFAYLGTVDTRIATPRKSSPRKKVPAGSVGIAGDQTGIYPLESPGGWQLIGRTDTQLFLPVADPPCLLRPGDRVQFFPQ